MPAWWRARSCTLPAVMLRPPFHLLLHLLGDPFQFRGAQAVLLGRHAVGVFYLLGDHLAVDAVTDVRLLFPADELRLALRLVLDGTVDGHVGFRYPLEPPLLGIVLPVQADAAQVVGVVLDVKRPVGVLLPPLVVGETGFREHLVRQLLAPDGDLYAGVGEGGRTLRPYPEDVHHVIDCHHVRFLVLALFIHFDTGNTGCRVFRLIPCFAGFGVAGFQLLQRVQLVLVGFDELQVRAAAFLFCRDIHTGEPPVLPQFLVLEPLEHALYRLGLPAVRGGRPVDMAYQVEKAGRAGPLVLLQPLVASLVVVHDLVGLVLAHLYRHPVCVVLRLEVFVVADVVAQQHLAVCVHHLVDHRGAHLAFPVPIIQVELRPVAIPQAVAPHGQRSPVLASVPLVACQLPVDGIVPERLYLRAAEPHRQAAQAFQPFPPLSRSYSVVFVEYERIRVDRHPAPLQGDQVTACLFGYLHRTGVAYLPGDERGVAAFPVAFDFVTQPCRVLRQGVVVYPPQVLAGGCHASPHGVEAVAVHPALRCLLLVVAHQCVEHGCVQGVFRSQFLAQPCLYAVHLVPVLLVKFPCPVVRLDSVHPVLQC